MIYSTVIYFSSSTFCLCGSVCEEVFVQGFAVGQLFVWCGKYLSWASGKALR